MGNGENSAVPEVGAVDWMCILPIVSIHAIPEIYDRDLS